MDKPNGNGEEVVRAQVPLVTITYDPRTYSVAIGGNVPSWEFCEALLYMALKETDRKINARRIQAGVAIAGPELLGALKGRGA